MAKLADAGYETHFRLLNTRDFNIPQNRPRVYVVGLRRDSVKHAFQWPGGTEPTVKAQQLLDKTAKGRTAETFCPSMKRTLKLALKRIRMAGGRPKKELYFVDVKASAAYASWMKDRCPCLTKARGLQGFYVTHSHYRRMMSMEEVMRFQGHDPERLSWVASGVSASVVGSCLGDGMSLNVVSLVQHALLRATGLA